MKNNNSGNTSPEHKEKRHGFLRALGITAIIVIIIGLIIGRWIKYNIYASEFSPTKLRPYDQKVLDDKLAALRDSAEDHSPARSFSGKDSEAPLEPEAYSELGARREINLTEKELNALIANKPEIARRVAIDLSEDLLSLKMIVPVDEDIIFLGGKTLRLNLGMILRYENDQLVVALKGVSLGGIPLPNAWLGYLKNKNLVEEFRGEGGFWTLFSEGVEDVRVREGHIRVRLRE